MTDKQKSRELHFMGIGGAGISAVAAFAHHAGYEVSGCDIDSNSSFLKELVKLGIRIEKSHDLEHINDTETLVVSPAIESLDPNNIELITAKEKKIPIFTGEEFLAQKLVGDKKVIAVTGTHGKSTTTAMVGWVLEKTGLDPSVLVGAVVNDWGTNYRIGKGNYFVIEADEYQEKFLLYQPDVAVVTAVEMDHPEYFKDEEAVKRAFRKFTLSVKENGYLVLGPNVQLDNPKAHKIEFSKRQFNLRLIGDFNQDNASLAWQVGKILGISEKTITQALESFNGVGRRFEFKGEEGGIKVFEDYAHHPTAVKVTTEAIRQKFPDNPIWIVYQPHMFSRTKYLLNEFVEVFKNLPVEHAVLIDIFAARQENLEKISSKDIVDRVRKENVKYIGEMEQAAYYLARHAQVGDIVIVMGAGDIYKLSSLFLEKLRNKV
ncbi:MAG TPA: Mur ligase domain-containing protein [Candidatus Nanoarchaeia archaeon]|nr:UDP-N-acetylmuramate--L-alanine ligase [uncultured archaeon]